MRSDQSLRRFPSFGALLLRNAVGCALIGAFSLMIGTSRAMGDDLGDWLATEENIAVQYMLSNISPSGAVPGAIVASPSKDNPDYFYHWIRDSAGVARVLDQLYQTSASPDDRELYSTLLTEFAIFSRETQLTPNRSGGIGEPKFFADGRGCAVAHCTRRKT